MKARIVPNITKYIINIRIGELFFPGTPGVEAWWDVFVTCLRLFDLVMLAYFSKKLRLKGIVYIETKLFAFF